MLNLLDGVFAIILIDNNINKLFVGRDPYGIRPIFYLHNPIVAWEDSVCDICQSNLIGFASEVKQLIKFTDKLENKLKIFPVSPGYFLSLELSSTDKWYITSNNAYTGFGLSRIGPAVKEINEELITNTIHDIFCAAVMKRVQTTDRPIACLLSGGLDSSIVTALVSKFYPEQLQTYSIGSRRFRRFVICTKGSNISSIHNIQKYLSQRMIFLVILHLS